MSRKLVSFFILRLLVLTMTIIVTFVLLFVGIVFMVLLHVIFSEILSRRGSSEETGANGGRSMSMNELEKLPCYDYVAKGSNTSSPVDCAVCLESLITGDKCRMLPMCKHSFHAQCVDTWLLKTPICPICRCNAHSHSGNQVVSNNGCFIEPNSGNMVQLRENHTNVDIENHILGSHNLVRGE